MSRCDDEALTTLPSDGHSMPLCPLGSRLSLPKDANGYTTAFECLALDAFGDFPSLSSLLCLILGGDFDPPHELGETRQWCLRETRHLCVRHAGRKRQVEYRVCVQRVLVYSAKVAMFNDPFWFQILIGTVATLTGQASNCCVSSRWRKASSHSSHGTFAPVCTRTRSAKWLSRIPSCVQ